jgi:excisionase family DNA binding protein
MTDTANLISIEQAAKTAGCSASYLRKLANENRIQIFKLNQRFYLVDKRSVEQFFSQPRKLGRPRKRD